MSINRAFKKANFNMSVFVKYFINRLLNITKGKNGIVHIIFALVDHYEPGTGSASKEIEIARVDELIEKYPVISSRHKDSNGRIPRRTWFFPPHYHRFGNLKKLVSLCELGYGEIELHLHHGKYAPDTSENLQNTIIKTMQEYSEFGIFGTEDGVKKYAFIHGDWALDNSRGGKFCGVNNEIDILRRTGCYADFTHPSIIETNPKQINSIFYAIGRDGYSKSYDKGRPVRTGNPGEGLMIIQGPLHPFFYKDKLFFMRALGNAICGYPLTNTRRIDAWVNTGIHVLGKPNIIFITTHTHGAIDSKFVLGDEIDGIFTCLETSYADNVNYKLHYVTAREMYNIIKAIESEQSFDDPKNWIDYRVKPPSYKSFGGKEEATKELKDLIAKTYLY